MKLKLILIITIVISQIPVFAQNWRFVFPQQPVQKMRDIEFLDKHKGWMVGKSGLMYSTTDGGNSWKLEYHPNHDPLKEISVVDENTRFVLEDIRNGFDSAFISVTTDNGLTWSQLNRPGAGVENLVVDIHFFNAQEGLAFCYGKVYKTTDQGNTWQLADEFLQGQGAFRDVVFINETLGWLVTSFGIYQTTDGGSNWLFMHQGFDLKAIDASDENHIWVTGENAYFLKSSDGGLTWTWYDTGAQGETLYDVDFLDNNHGIVVGGKVHRTTDGGNTWTSSNNYINLYKVVMLSEDEIIGAFNKKSFDGGLTFKDCFYKEPSNMLPNYTVALNMDTFFTQQYLHTLYKTTDRGKNWEIISTGVDTPATALKSIVDFTIVNDTLILMSNGIQIFRSTDGGYQWTTSAIDTNIVLPNPTYHIGEFNMVNDQIGFVVLNKRLYKTTNGGQNWSIITSHSLNSGVGCIDFIDINSGWITEYSTDFVLKTNNSGLSWDTLQSPMLFSTTDCHKIKFIDHNNGWLADNNGTLYRTTNGGISWNTSISNLDISTFDFDFIDNLNGRIVGNRSYQTSDGGQTWTDFEHRGDLYISPQIKMFSSTEYVINYYSDILVNDGQPAICINLEEISMCGDSIVDYNGVSYTSSGYYTLNKTSDTIYRLLVLENLKPLINQTEIELSTKLYHSYQWYLDGSPIADATYSEYIPSTSGWYQVEVSDENGCIGISDSVLFIMVNTNQIALRSTNLKVFPNPTSDNVTVKFDANNYDIEIFDVLGRIVYEKRNCSSNLEMIDIKHLRSGQYFIKCSNDLIYDITKLVIY